MVDNGADNGSDNGADNDKRRPAGETEEEQSGFLGRWARRKREARAQEPEPSAESVASEPGQGDAAAEAVDPETLPDPDELSADADFSVFMRQGVPEALQRRALRRLWRINPLFGHLDRLNDYDDDYTDAATVVQGLKSLYKVGKGMVSDDEEEAQKEKIAGGEAESESPEDADPSAPAEPADEVAEKRPASPREDEKAAAADLPDETSRPKQSKQPKQPAPPERTNRPDGGATGGRRNAATRRWNRFST